MRIVALLLGSFLALGCQSRKDASESSAPSPAADHAEPAAAEEEPEAAPPEPDDSAATGDTAVEANPLVGEIMGLTRTQTVTAVEEAIQITFPLEVSPKVDADSPPKAVTDAMMFAIFYTLPQVYENSDNLDELRQVFTFKGDTIGEVTTTRASFESLGYREAMAGATDEKAKRSAQKKLLRQLPKGAVKIDKKYRP